MALLQDIRGLFTRRKPVTIDLKNSQAGAIARHSELIEPKANSHRPAEATVESADRRNPRARSGDLSQGIDDVLGMAKTINRHLEKQVERGDTLLRYMERLPAALDALPEINRQNARLLEIITEHLKHAGRREEALNHTLNGLTDASSRHTDVLGLIQQQLDANNQTSGTLLENLASFRDALGELASSNAQTTSVLRDMTKGNDAREREMAQMLGRTQRWMIAAMVCCAAASITAVAVAAVSLLGG